MQFFTFCLEAAVKSKINAESTGSWERWKSFESHLFESFESSVATQQILTAAPGEANSSRIRPIIFAFSPVYLDAHRPSAVTCGL